MHEMRWYRRISIAYGDGDHVSDYTVRGTFDERVQGLVPAAVGGDHCRIFRLRHRMILSVLETFEASEESV